LFSGQTYYLPDCDYPVNVPVPKGGAIEGQTGYSCPRDSEDCHLLVVDRDNGILYESYQASIDNGSLVTTCTVTWDMCLVYPPNGRGEQCTSSDAAGFPIIPLLFTADEVASGVIDHAIRFILPNNRIRSGVYVHPASHAGGPQAPSPAPIYGTRFRLKQSFDDSSFSAPARVVIQALKKYGMFLADGGSIALTAANDMFTTAKWSTLGFTSRSLFGIQVTDFEVVDGGSRIILTYDCVRNNLSSCTTPSPSSLPTPPTTTTSPSPSSLPTPSTTTTSPSPSSTVQPTSTTGRPSISTGSTLYNTFLNILFFFALSFPFL
jgi:serine/threonine-protein kinase